MRFEKPVRETLENESDVEQKFAYALLVGAAPEGLEHRPETVSTKKDIRKVSIGKGTSQKLHFPDYLIAIASVPLLIVEAKTPGSDLIAAFGEARMYAGEVNASYPTGQNPLRLIIATDGLRVLAGRYDQADPLFDLTLEEIDPTNETFSKFASTFGSAALEAAAKAFAAERRPKRYWMPRRMVGGGGLQNEEIGDNTFGRTITTDFSYIFNPRSKADRAAVVKQAYVHSTRRDRYVEPIDKVIRLAASPAEARSKAIEDTAKPKEILAALRRGQPLEHQTLLLIGSAGAGKTTFVDYLSEVALPADIRESTVWLRINMINAPVSRDIIYGWLREEIIKGFEQSMPDLDFDDLETLKAVHATDINKFRKGVGRLLQGNAALYDQKLAEEIISIQSDRHRVAINYSRYCSTERRKLMIVVLDNCDKRLRDEQLIMFEAAQWLQREFRTLVILPLREETYDNFSEVPPLDTVLKDLVFRIEPPQFQRILLARIQMAFQSIKFTGKTLQYKLPNGMTVQYPASDQAYYLSSMVRSMFEHDRFLRRLITGLSGRNMRRAMEIFLEFCSSGHIGEDVILKIRQSEGAYVLPLALVTRVLLRKRRRFYASQGSYVRNLYAISEFDERPHFFARLLILRWLQERLTQKGLSRFRGYFSVGDMRRELETFGVLPDVFAAALEDMLDARCVASEDFRTSDLEDAALVSLAPAGVAHLSVMSDFHYLGAIAEDTWFEAEADAKKIAARISEPDSHFSPRTLLFNAFDTVEYFAGLREREAAAIAAVRQVDDFERLTDLGPARYQLTRAEKQLVAPAWVGAYSRYKPGSEIEAVVNNVVNYGVFVTVGGGISGLLHASVLPKGWSTSPAFASGTQINVRVESVDPALGRLSLIPA